MVCRGLAWDKPQAGPRQGTARCGCRALDLLLEQAGFVQSWRNLACMLWKHKWCKLSVSKWRWADLLPKHPLELNYSSTVDGDFKNSGWLLWDRAVKTDTVLLLKVLTCCLQLLESLGNASLAATGDYTVTNGLLNLLQINASSSGNGLKKLGRYRNTQGNYTETILYFLKI